MIFRISECMQNTGLDMQTIRQASTPVIRVCTSCKQGHEQCLLEHALHLNSNERDSLPIPHRHPKHRKYAVCFRSFTSLVCLLLERYHTDNPLHILSGCQCPIIHNIIIEHATLPAD
eukprot:765597-Pelagomonas_calceolata.AAC.1